MNWEAIGALGEVLGAIAVVATLFYLSRQIRQNSHSLDQSNRYARASSVHQTNALFAHVFSQLAQDAELAAIYHRALARESLDEVESVRFAAFLNTFFAWLEATYTQAVDGLTVAGSEVDLFMEVLGPFSTRLLQTEAGRVWWSTDAPHQYHPTFVAAVNELVLKKARDEPAVSASSP